MMNDVLNLHDESTSNEVGFSRPGLELAGSGDWAYQVELKMNSHSRPNFDFGAEVGASDGAKQVRLAIARDRVGFQGHNGDSFINGAFVSLSTTDGFHLFRVVKQAGQFSLYIDDLNTPRFTVPYADMIDGAISVTLAGTSNGGVSDFDVKSFAFNPSGTFVPEPASVLLFLSGVSTLCLRRAQRNRVGPVAKSSPDRRGAGRVCSIHEL